METEDVVVEPSTRHRFDYYYHPGSELRPIPVGKDEWADAWLPCRRFLFSPWFTVERKVTATPATRLFDDHMWQGDEPADAVVNMFAREGAHSGRAMFEQALNHGITSVPDAPDELVRFFDIVESVPEWYDVQRGRRGLHRLLASTTPSMLITAVFAVIDTVMNGDVSAATGATGRFRNDSKRRGTETVLFFASVLSTPAPGPGSAAFNAAVHVRLMHAQARRGLRIAWGEKYFAQNGNPISNSSLCGFFESMMLSILIDHSWGRTLSRADLDDVWHFLSYWSWLMGVEEAILPRNGIDALRNLDYLLARNGKPSVWRAELLDSLIGSIPDRTDTIPTRSFVVAQVISAAAQALLGGELVREMFAGNHWEKYLHPAIGGRVIHIAGRLLAPVGWCRDRLPGIDSFRKPERSINGRFVLATQRAMHTAIRHSSRSEFSAHDRSLHGDGIKRQ